tara:strand:+ start:151 stop:759 length:609 start_codon:yes stop_codon:yes gene_type:complete
MSTIKTNQLAHTANGASVYTLPQTDGSAGQVLKTDGSGNLSWTTPSQGISMIDSWRLTSDTANGNNGTQTSWAAATNMNASSLGSALTYDSSSGLFSFPSTGHYLIIFSARFFLDSGNDGAANIDLQVTNDGSSFDVGAMLSYGAQEGGTRSTTTGHFVFDVTSTTTCKFKFVTHSMSSSSDVTGNATENQTYFQVIRLGDT